MRDSWVQDARLLESLWQGGEVEAPADRPQARSRRPCCRSVGSGRVFLGERQPELLLVLDEARQLCAEEWLELRAGFLKSLL